MAHAMELDEVDRRILSALQADARLSMRSLATRVGVSTPTASAKVRALEALGVIRGYHARIDPRLLGRAGQLVEVETRPSRARALAEAIGALEGIEDVTETAGGRLFARHLSASHQATQALVESLAQLDDVVAYRLHPIIAQREGARSVVEDATSLDIRCHLCDGPIHGAGVRRRWDEDGQREHVFCCRNCAAAFGERLVKLATGAKGARRAARR